MMELILAGVMIFGFYYRDQIQGFLGLSKRKAPTWTLIMAGVFLGQGFNVANRPHFAAVAKVGLSRVSSLGSWLVYGYCRWCDGYYAMGLCAAKMKLKLLMMLWKLSE